jgi:hypothetical protein
MRTAIIGCAMTAREDGIFRPKQPMRFRNPNQPTIRPQKDYAPTRSAVKPQGFAEIEAVSQLPPDAEGWALFMADVAHMPAEMTAAVQAAIRQPQWRISPNPMAAIRKVAYQEARRRDGGERVE